MRIVELILGDDEFTGIEAISVVENPAIEEDFIALKSEEIKLAEVDSIYIQYRSINLDLIILMATFFRYPRKYLRNKFEIQ